MALLNASASPPIRPWLLYRGRAEGSPSLQNRADPMIIYKVLPLAFVVAALCSCANYDTGPHFSSGPAQASENACPSADAAVRGGDAAAADVIHGSAGDVLHLEGANFDATGETEVYFGDVLSPSVICPTTTQCTTVVPPGSGVVPITVEVFGECGSFGEFAYALEDAGPDPDASLVAEAGLD